MGAKGMAKYDSRRVASEVATSVVACRLTATERSGVDARAQTEHLSAGELARRLLLASSKATPERVGLAPDPTVAASARWLVQLVQQVPELPAPVVRAAADLHVDDLVVAGDATALDEIGDAADEAASVVRRRAKEARKAKASPAPAGEAVPPSGPRPTLAAVASPAAPAPIGAADLANAMAFLRTIPPGGKMLLTGLRMASGDDPDRVVAKLQDDGAIHIVGDLVMRTGPHADNEAKLWNLIVEKLTRIEPPVSDAMLHDTVRAVAVNSPYPGGFLHSDAFRERFPLVLAGMRGAGAIQRVGSAGWALAGAIVAPLPAPAEPPPAPADDDPVAEMAAAAAAGKAPPLRVDPLADVVWPPAGWVMGVPPYDGKLPTLRDVLRMIGAAKTKAVDPKEVCIWWKNVAPAQILRACEILLEKGCLVRVKARWGWLRVTDLGSEVLSLSAAERTVDLPMPGAAPKRVAVAPPPWRRTWVGKGKAHTVDGIDRGRTVCGERIQAPKWRSAPEEAEDCAKCARMRTSATARGAAQEARP